MDNKQRKQRRNLRLGFFVIAPVMMFIMIAFGQDLATAAQGVVTFFIPASLVYTFFAWRQRCPQCRQSFALDIDDQGSFHRTYACRYCEHVVTRWGGPTSGSGGGGG